MWEMILGLLYCKQILYHLRQQGKSSNKFVPASKFNLLFKTITNRNAGASQVAQW